MKEVNANATSTEGKSFELKDLAPTSSTPNDFLVPTKDTGFNCNAAVSEEITFNSNDGLSFADSILGSDINSGVGFDVDEDDDEQSTSSAFSFPGMDKNGILAADSEDETEDPIVEKLIEDSVNEAIKEAKEKSNAPPTANRPPSGNSSTRTSPRASISGIPRLVRSRSNSLNSEVSGFLSRRGSTASMVSTSAPPLPSNPLSNDQEHFIEQNVFSYYNEHVVTTMLQNIEKKSQPSFLNPEFMVKFSLNILLRVFQLTSIRRKNCTRMVNHLTSLEGYYSRPSVSFPKCEPV